MRKFTVLLVLIAFLMPLSVFAAPKVTKAESASGVEIQKKDKEKTKIKKGDVSADTSLEIEEEGTGEAKKIKAKLSNGKNAEIKIMPDTASARALEVLRLKNCVESEGCTIELKEVGKDSEKSISYELKTKKKAKLFGLFNVNMNVSAEIDADSGEAKKTKKPWWAFLAKEVE